MAWTSLFWPGLLVSVGIGQQHRQEMPIMDNITRYDDRLPNKTYA